LKKDKERKQLKDAITRIMLKRPTEFTKRYYSIGEVADMFPGLTTSKIRFWESNFNTIKPQKDTSGNRRFTKKDIDSLRIVYHLVQDKGYTLDGAKREIHENSKKYEQKIDVIDSLTDIKQMLLSLKNEIS
jgi:DNA-binding transcriptional MerR regulator|tara:strand:+ start:113 stop:505 length:393 start_codon:yes stop_codon:yes gene_type:complete